MEKINTEFRNKYTTEMEKVSFLDLVPNLTTEDVKPDTEGSTYDIEADPKTNPFAG